MVNSWESSYYIFTDQLLHLKESSKLLQFLRSITTNSDILGNQKKNRFLWNLYILNIST